MAVIGTFTRARNGGWEGSIRTFTTTVKVRFVPNDDRTSDTAPHFHVVTAQCEVGAAWVRRKAERPAEYLSVQFDDPAFERPFSAALFYADGGETAQLVWNRRHQGGNDA